MLIIICLTNHVTSSNYMAQKPSNFYIFFLMQRIDYIVTKKGNFNEICTMFIGREIGRDYYILTCTYKFLWPISYDKIVVRL